MAYPYREGCARRCAKLRAVGLDGVQGVPQQVTEPPHPPNSTNPSHETPRCTLTLCYRGTACGPDGAARNLLALLRSCSAGDLPLPPPRAAKWLASTWALASRPQNHFFYVEVDCTTSGPGCTRLSPLCLRLLRTCLACAPVPSSRRVGVCVRVINKARALFTLFSPTPSRNPELQQDLVQP
jgi:hypothetical protein